MLTHPLCFGVNEGMQLDRTSLEVILLSVHSSHHSLGVSSLDTFGEGLLLLKLLLPSLFLALLLNKCGEVDSST